MQIRQMTAADIDEIDLLENQIFSVPWSRGDFEICIGNPALYYIVAEEDGHIAGYCGMCMVLDEAEIQNVAVAPEYRRKGIAVAMLNALFEFGEKKQIIRYMLEVRDSNVPARSLYERLGFTQVGRRKDYYEKPREDAILMDKIIGEINA